MRKAAAQLRLAVSLVTLAGLTTGGILLLRDLLEEPEPRVEILASTTERPAPAAPITFAPRQGWSDARPAASGTARPASLRIPGFALEAPIVPRSIDPATGAFDLPPDASTVAWWEPGPTPGDAGSAVLAAHVDYGGRVGVFYRLAEATPGERVEVAYNDGTVRAFEVTGVVHYPKSSLPVGQVFRSGGPPSLTLVTCGGTFDRATRHYSDNTVVTAVPVAS